MREERFICDHCKKEIEYGPSYHVVSLPDLIGTGEKHLHDECYEKLCKIVEKFFK